MSGFYHPSSEIEFVVLAVTALTPEQVKATPTKCRGILISAASAVVLVGDVTSQPLRIPTTFPAPFFLPIDDASKIYIDVAAGTINVGVAIVK